MKHKLAQVMIERNGAKRLNGACKWTTPMSAASAPASLDAARRARHPSLLLLRLPTAVSDAA
jgi:hypothetical protein